MAWTSEISQLVNEVDQLTDAVNVKLTTLNQAVANTQTSAASAANSAVAAANSAVSATSSAQAANTHLNTALAVYGSTAAQQTALATSQNIVTTASFAADSASSIQQQNLSGINAEALHRSPNAITSMFIYDTSKDSDGGAWTEKCQHTSWWNEPVMGKWLSAHNSERNARFQGATIGASLGDPYSSVSGYAVSSGSTPTISGGWLAFNPGVSNAWASKDYTTVAGRTYRLTGTFRRTSSNAVVFAGIGSGAAQHGSITLSGSGTFVFYFIATSTTSNIGIQSVSGTLIEFQLGALVEVTALNTTSGDYYQSSTDGLFYRLWKNTFSSTETSVDVSANATATSKQVNIGDRSIGGWSVAVSSVGVTTGVSKPYTSPIGVDMTLSVYVVPLANQYIYVSTNHGGQPNVGAKWRIDTQTGIATLVYSGNIQAAFCRLVTLGSGLFRVEATWRSGSATNARAFAIFCSNTSETTGANVYITPTALPNGPFEVAGWQREFGLATETSPSATTYEAKGVEGSVSEVFRGNKRDFPRLAGIVNEINGITIYDLTEPGRPMWKMFRTYNFTLASSYEHTLYISRGTLASVSCIAGLVCVGSTNLGGNNPINGGGLHIFDFAQDRIYSRIGFYGGDTGRMIGMHQYSTVDSGTAAYRHNLPGIASIVVNAVAATVLPDAPIDPVTGLRVPTIAVQTASGVSVINNDGTVAVLTKGFNETSNFGSIWITPRAVYATTVGGSGGQCVVGWTNFKTNNSNFYYVTSFSGAQMPFGNIFGSGQRPFAKNTFALVTQQVGTTNRTLSLVTENRSGGYLRAIGTVIADTHATGMMTADTRRCYLSDTGAGSVAGTELVTNGTFDTDTTGWTLAGGTTAVGASGVTFTNVTSRTTLSQTLTLVAGRSYVVTGIVNNLTSGANGAVVRITSTNAFGGTQVTQFSTTAPAGDVPFTLTFTATTGTLYIWLANNVATAGFQVSFDSISIREVVTDRSYRAAFAPVTGTLTKTALATSTSLMGYSGWSNSNYLRESYSSDLDFGTGEFNASAWVNIPTTLSPASFPLGPELLTNGGFDTDTTWTKDPGWTISGGVANANVTSFNAIYNAIPTTVANKTFDVTLTASVTSGSIGFGIGVNGNEPQGPITTSGTTTTRIRSASSITANQVYIRGASSFVGTIDNVSVREVLPLIIFDRAHSTGTRLRLGVNPSGQLTAEAFDGTTIRTVTTTVAYNTATWFKTDVNYTTDGSLAILVNGREVAATRGTPLLSLNSRYNLLTFSEQFDNAAWSKLSGWAVSPNTIATTDPLGGNTADAIIPTAGTTLPYTRQIVTVSPVRHTMSVWVKKGVTRWIQIVDGNEANSRAWFDLDLGVAGTKQSAVLVNTITGVGNGWYRIVIEFIKTNSSLEFAVQPASADNSAATITWNGTDVAFYLWGADLRVSTLNALPYQRVTAVTDFDFQAPLTIGNSFALDAPFPGSVALLKLGATVPTPEQATFMYEQEKQLFRAGAQSVLPDATTIVDVSYDDVTDRWVAVSASNESYWTGLVRNSVTPVPAGSYSRVVANSGVELTARTTTNPGVDLTIPAYILREELNKRSEPQTKLNRQVAVFDYVGGFTGNITNGSTAITSVTNLTYPASYIGARINGTGIPANATITGVSGTTIYISAPASATTTGVTITFSDFELPVGYTAEQVSSSGTVRREGSTSDYTRLYDGFVETIRFATAPGATAHVQIKASRSSS